MDPVIEQTQILQTLSDVLESTASAKCDDGAIQEVKYYMQLEALWILINLATTDD